MHIVIATTHISNLIVFENKVVRLLKKKRKKLQYAATIGHSVCYLTSCFLQLAEAIGRTGCIIAVYALTPSLVNA